MECTYEVHEDRAGGLHVFALDGEDVVWGRVWGEDEEHLAAREWVRLMVDRCEPVGWESGEGVAEDYEECCRTGHQIASSEWDELDDECPLGVSAHKLGRAGERFGLACGALWECAYCCEIGERWKDEWGDPYTPETCPVCGHRTGW